MRRAWPAIPILAAFIAVVACGDDDEAVAPSTIPDAGVLPSDGAPRNESDAAVVDPKDAATDVAAPDPRVTVNVVDALGPLAGISVAFQEPSGATRIAMTDAAGNTSDVVPAGSSVTAYAPAIAGLRAASLATVAGVSAGETVHVRLASFPSQQIEATLAAFPGPGTATSMHVYACGFDYGSLLSNGGVASRNVYRCKDAQGRLPILVTASDAASLVLGFATKSLADADGGAALMTTVSTGDWTAAPTANTFSTSAAPPAGVTSVIFSTGFLHDGFELGRVMTTRLAGPYEHTFVSPPAAFAPKLRRIVDLVAAGAGTTRSFVVQEPTVATNRQQDIAALPPSITAATLTGTNDAPIVDVTTDVPFTTSNGASLELATDNPDGPHWQIRLAGGASTKLQPPKLPAAFLTEVTASAGWTRGDLQLVESSAFAIAKAWHELPIDFFAADSRVPLPSTDLVFRSTRRAVTK